MYKNIFVGVLILSLILVSIYCGKLKQDNINHTKIIAKMELDIKNLNKVQEEHTKIEQELIKNEEVNRIEYDKIIKDKEVDSCINSNVPDDVVEWLRKG